MHLEAIGHVRSCFGSKFGVPRQPGLCPSAWGEVVFEEGYRNVDALRGIEGFSHLWLIFGFHHTADKGWKPTVRPPRLGGNERVGVFASRSTHRPNGLGLSLVTLEGVEDADGMLRLRVGGLDLLDGTPVYDIKPYLAYAESLPDARSGFAGEEMPRLEVRLGEHACPHFERLPARARQLILEALALDPRPPVQRGDEGRIFGALLCGHDVRFRVSGSSCTIVELVASEHGGLAQP